MSNHRLFEGEKWLVVTSMIGFLLAAAIAIVILARGPIVLPEGNLQDAFSFHAAIGIFFLSIAAILPFTEYKERKRKIVRWMFIAGALYAYGVETVQHFRGINPRFSREGSVIDLVAGALFGVVSLLLILLGLILTVRFFRIKSNSFILAIRYAFLSVLIANMAGLVMSLLQGRHIGDTGNLIVLHGIGYHALQTLLIPGWLLQQSQASSRFKKGWTHIGGIAWMSAIVLIGLQTGMGRSVFELTILPVLAAVMLLVWFGMTVLSFVVFLGKMKERMDRKHLFY